MWRFRNAQSIRTPGRRHTPQGYQITLRGWSLDYVEADEITEWTATVVQRNPLLLKEDAVNELFFEADETGKVLFQAGIPYPSGRVPGYLNGSCVRLIIPLRKRASDHLVRPVWARV